MRTAEATWLATTKLMLWRVLDEHGVDPRALFEEVGLNPDALKELYMSHGDTVFDPAELEAAAFGAFEQKLPAFSQKFQGKAFVYMQVDCMMFPCLISGKIFRSGRVIFKQEAQEDGGDRLLFQSGMYAQGSTFQHLMKIMLG